MSGWTENKNYFDLLARKDELVKLQDKHLLLQIKFRENFTIAQ
jgi:hypothetical protein